MSTIILIRHCETDLSGRFCGHSDPDLNPSGKREAIRVAEEVSKLNISRIFSSDLRRAVQTAKAIADRTEIEVDYDTSLREIHFGQWEGLTWHEIESRFAEEAAQWLRKYPLQGAPGGEDYAAFVSRAETAIAVLLREAQEATVAVVTHRGVMRHALINLFGFEESDASTRTAAYGSTVITMTPQFLREELPLSQKHFRGIGGR